MICCHSRPRAPQEHRAPAPRPHYMFSFPTIRFIRAPGPGDHQKHISIDSQQCAPREHRVPAHPWLERIINSFRGSIRPSVRPSVRPAAPSLSQRSIINPSFWGSILPSGGSGGSVVGPAFHHQSVVPRVNQSVRPSVRPSVRSSVRPAGPSLSQRCIINSLFWG